MHILRLFLLPALIFPALAMGQTPGQCTDKPECWPEGSAMHTGLLLHQNQEKIEKQMGAKHAELVDLVSAVDAAHGRLVEALRSQQAAWAKYRSEECELIGALTGAGGSWPSTWAAQCTANHTDQRLRRIRSAITCIQKIPTDNRAFEQNRCLQQLAPLTNR
jgi:uncharacterized protein YecT (DUF1311 family)